jgi:hypothetical protein
MAKTSDYLQLDTSRALFKFYFTNGGYQRIQESKVLGRNSLAYFEAIFHIFRTLYNTT